MAAPAKANAILTALAVFACRASLGLYFALAGVSKISGGYAGWMSQYRGMSPSFLPTWFSEPYGYAVPVAEVVLGAMLVVGLLGRLTATLVLLMLVSFTIAILMAGKFNAAGGPFHSNVILITLAAWLAVHGAGPISVDRFVGRGGTVSLS